MMKLTRSHYPREINNYELINYEIGGRNGFNKANLYDTRGICFKCVSSVWIGLRQVVIRKFET